MDQERTTRCRIHLVWWSVAILPIHHPLLPPDHIRANHCPVRRIRLKRLVGVRRLVGLQFTQMRSAGKATIEGYRTCASAVHPTAIVASGRKDIESLLRHLNLTVPSSKTNSGHVAFICRVTKRPMRLRRMRGI